MRDDHQRLKDIHEAILRIEKYARSGRDHFDREDWLQVWVVPHLQIIGERLGDSPTPCASGSAMSRGGVS